MRRIPPATVIRGQPDFVRLLTAQLAAQAADGAAQVVLADALVLEPLGAKTPGRVLAISALTLLPYSLISPFFGVFVDRWPRRTILVATSAIRVVLLAPAAWAVGVDAEVAWLYALALLLVGLGRLFLTAKGAALPATLHEQNLLRGNAVSGGGGMIAALAGGVLGLAVVALVSGPAALAVAGVLYATSAIAAQTISSTLPREAAPRLALSGELRRVASELVDGVRQAWRRLKVRVALIAIFLLRAVVIFVAIAAIIVIKEEFPQAADRFGRLSVSAVALGVAGAGAFLGAVSAPWIGRRLDRSGLVLLGFGVSALGLILLGAIASLVAILALVFVSGYGAFVTKVAVDAIVQEEMPDHYRGRAFALYDILYNVASVVAAGAMVAVGVSETVRGPLVSVGLLSLGAGLALMGAMARAGMLRSTAP